MKVYKYYVYILTNKTNTVFYIGATSDLEGRVWQHKQKVFQGFTAKYNCDKLVYFEEYQWVQDAIGSERQLKAGSRKSKVELVFIENPGWIDLSALWYD